MPKKDAPPGGRRYVEAARRVLETGGSQAVTMRAVADAAGTTATAIYRHFPDKSALLDAVYVELLEEFGSDIEAATRDPATPARDRLLAGLEAYRDFGLRHPAGFSLLFLEDYPERRSRYPDDFRRPRSATFRRLVDGVTACVDAGTIAPTDPVEFALVLDAQVLGLMALHRSGRFGTDTAEFRRFFRAALERLLG